MKFSCDIKIDAPINHVVKVFENPDSLKHYQDDFISIEHISGEKGSEGAVSKLVYKQLELKETIITNKLPDVFKALYEHKHMTNTMEVSFKSISENQTLYISEIHYTNFNGFFIKVMAKLFPGMFKKQVYKWMVQFKTYTESLDF